MNNQWQDNLRNRMERHQEPALDGLWDDIEQIITAGSVDKKRLWVKRTAAAAAAVVLLFIALRTWKENQKNTQWAEQTPRQQVVPIAHPHKKETVAEIAQPLLVHTTEAGKSGFKNPSQADDTCTFVAADETAARETGDNRQPVNDNELPPGLGTDNSIPDFQLPARRRRRPVQWQTDIYASNIPSGAARTYDGYASLSSYEFPSQDEEYVIAAIRSDAPEDILLQKEYQHVYTDIKHFHPIILGVSMKYNFDEKWSVTSGLTYSILLSQLRSGNDNNYYKSNQTLHYVGIPLSMNYTVWENNKITTYVSGGGLVEKNVSGVLSTDYVIDNKIVKDGQQDVSVKPLQWSVNSAVGIQYQLSGNIGIYAEPGIAYHFKNSSGVETIYREKPLNFNIRLGLRFSFNE